MRLLTALLLLSAVVSLPPGARAAEVLATTDLGPITLNDLQHEVDLGVGLPEGSLGEADQQTLPRLLRRAARLRVLSELARQRGLTASPLISAEISLHQTDALSRLGLDTLVSSLCAEVFRIDPDRVVGALFPGSATASPVPRLLRA